MHVILDIVRTRHDPHGVTNSVVAKINETLAPGEKASLKMSETIENMVETALNDPLTASTAPEGPHGALVMTDYLSDYNVPVFDENGNIVMLIGRYSSSQKQAAYRVVAVDDDHADTLELIFPKYEMVPVELSDLTETERAALDLLSGEAKSLTFDELKKKLNIGDDVTSTYLADKHFDPRTDTGIPVISDAEVIASLPKGSINLNDEYIAARDELISKTGKEPTSAEVFSYMVEQAKNGDTASDTTNTASVSLNDVTNVANPESNLPGNVVFPEEIEIRLQEALESYFNDTLQNDSPVVCLSFVDEAMWSEGKQAQAIELLQNRCKKKGVSITFVTEKPESGKYSTVYVGAASVLKAYGADEDLSKQDYSDGVAYADTDMGRFGDRDYISKEDEIIAEQISQLTGIDLTQPSPEMSPFGPTLPIIYQDTDDDINGEAEKLNGPAKYIMLVDPEKQSTDITIDGTPIDLSGKTTKEIMEILGLDINGEAENLNGAANNYLDGPTYSLNYPESTYTTPKAYKMVLVEDGDESNPGHYKLVPIEADDDTATGNYLEGPSNIASLKDITFKKCRLVPDENVDDPSKTVYKLVPIEADDDTATGNYLEGPTIATDYIYGPGFIVTDISTNPVMEKIMSKIRLTAFAVKDYGEGWSIIRTGDFNGNGTTDVLVANPTAASDTVGLIGYWENNEDWTLIGGYSPEWSVIATADFDGNGTTDILWRNSFVGDDGNTYNAYCTWIVDNDANWRMVSASDAAEWDFLCTGDFDGDGTKDIAMINAAGVVDVWRVVDGVLQSDSVLSVVDTSAWEFFAVGDFDDDGTDDIAWRSADCTTYGYWQIRDGQLAAWEASSAPNTVFVISTIPGGEYLDQGATLA